MIWIQNWRLMVWKLAPYLGSKLMDSFLDAGFQQRQHQRQLRRLSHGCSKLLEGALLPVVNNIVSTVPIAELLLLRPIQLLIVARWTVLIQRRLGRLSTRRLNVDALLTGIVAEQVLFRDPFHDIRLRCRAGFRIPTFAPKPQVPTTRALRVHRQVKIRFHKWEMVIRKEIRLCVIFESRRTTSAVVPPRGWSMRARCCCDGSAVECQP